MILLISGVILWSAAHFFKRLAPARRARMGDRAKKPISLILFLSVLMMIFGYRWMEYLPVYQPIPGMGHLNNLLMLISLFLFGVGGTKGTLYPRLRHPMLLGTILWSIAHLLVNGDLASILLFGGIGLWAVVQIPLINRAEIWVPPINGRGLKGDMMNLAGTLILFGLIAGVHIWLGHSPFLGTY